MSSYTNVFGGQTINTSNDSYTLVNLNANASLSWPTEFQNVNQVVNYNINVNPSAGGFNLTLPSATFTSVGKEFTVYNISAFGFNLNTNNNVLLQAVAAGTSINFLLINNTTAAGTWIVTPNGGGAPAVTSVNADVPDATDAANLQIAGGPIINNGILHFEFEGDLDALISFAGNAGIAVRTAVNTWALRSIVPAANGNIQITNGNGVAGNMTVDVTATLGVPPQNPITQIQVGNINIQGNIISSTNANGNISLQPNGTGETNITNNISILTGALLKYYNADNSHFISFSGSALPAGGGGFDLNLTWPATVPVVGQVLQYIGGGPPNLRWGTVPTFIGLASTDTAIARYSGAAGALQNSGVLIDNANNVTTAGTVTSDTSFISGDIFLSALNSTIGTTANTLNISPGGGNPARVNSNLFIGTIIAPRGLFFPQISGFTVSLAAPAVLAGNVALTLPATVGAATALMQSDGTGILSFTNIAGGTGTSGTVASAAVTRTAVSTVNPVVPGNMVAHDGVVKSWGCFSGATGAATGTYNAVTARNAVGNYTVTFATNMANVNYEVNINPNYNGASYLTYYQNKLVNGFTILAFLLDGVTAVDPNEISFSCLGRQF